MGTMGRVGKRREETRYSLSLAGWLAQGVGGGLVISPLTLITTKDRPPFDGLVMASSMNGK